MAEKKLTKTAVRNAKATGKLFDGAGLYLRVGGGGAHKSWMVRFTLNGDRIDHGIGSASLLSLDDARAEAERMRRDARMGVDPRRMKQERLTSFSGAARTVHKLQTATAKNRKAAAQWISSLEMYCFPKLGNRPIGDINSDDVLAVIEPIWTEKHETASRVLQRVSKVFDWAIEESQYKGENPTARLRSRLPKVKAKVKHHAALPWKDLPDFWTKLSDRSETAISALCLQMIVLTATRSGEARGAEWSEFDLNQGVWTIPAKRMKTETDHRIPLTNDMRAVLGKVKGAHKRLVFPSPRSKVLSDQAFARLYERMGVGGITTHGFRSAFKDWASDTGAAPDELSEVALSHNVGSAVRRAYARSDVFERRRKLMGQWNAYVTSAEKGV